MIMALSEYCIIPSFRKDTFVVSQAITQVGKQAKSVAGAFVEIAERQAPATLKGDHSATGFAH